ncbi:MAG: hypothetical protein IKU77_02505 [Alistipes sp.]|nr:hypothetical protein [Alistipes sp.]
MQERKLTEAESLALITQMIQNTHRRLTVNAGKPYLVWGYLTVAVSLFEWLVVINDWSLYWLYAWWLIPALGFPLMLLTCRKKPTEPKNYIDRAMESVWLVCSIALIPAFLMVLCTRGLSILSVVLLLIGIGTWISGRLIQAKGVSWGGILFLAGSILLEGFGYLNAYLRAHEIITDNRFLQGGQILIFAVLFIVGMIIPGHILNAKTRKHA